MKEGTTWKWFLIVFKYKNDVAVRVEKIDEKMGHLSSFHVSLNCPKKCIFGNFVLTPARNLSLLKQFTYMHLKVLSENGMFYVIWATVHEKLAIKISKMTLN